MVDPTHGMVYVEELAVAAAAGSATAVAAAVNTKQTQPPEHLHKHTPSNFLQARNRAETKETYFTSSTVGWNK